MGFILGFVGACLGIIAGVFIIVFIIYVKVRKMVGGFRLKDLKNDFKKIKNYEQEEYTRPKNVSGLTKVLEPSIIRDFGDFNKEFLYNKVEKNLIKIFNALEDKSVKEIKNDNDLIYIYPYLNQKIIDMKNDNINVKYDSVHFHSHAIKNYLKSAGKATVTVSSTLEYYYSDNSKDFAKKRLTDLKKQTRYTTEFVYVYDEIKFKYNQNALTVCCSNCGAPLKKLGSGNCEYCGTYVEHINLKNWYMISYAEDYK